MQRIMLAGSAGAADITGMVQKIDWSGSCEQAARKLALAYINAPYDPVVSSLPVPALGDYVSFQNDGEELFFGRNYSCEKTSTYGTVTGNFIDDSQLLLKNKARYNFKHTTPEGVAAMVLADFQFPAGDLASTGVEIESLIIEGDSAMDIIVKAYNQAAKKNGKKYVYGMEGRTFYVREKGEKTSVYELAEDKNITESKFAEQMDNLVNKVVIYDEKGNRIGEVSDGSSAARYGSYQEIYQKEKDVPDYQTAAKNLMTDPEQSISVTALGNTSCIAGRAVTLRDTATGLHGVYWIKSDRHTWENGIHTMQLELSFKEIGGGNE